MPICSNPLCGKTVASFTQFCPHCGKPSLSSIDKSGWETTPDRDISMEAFENSTRGTSAPKERKVSRRRLSKTSSGSSRWATRQITLSLSRKAILAIVAGALAATYVTYLFAPNIFPSFAYNGIYKTETAVMSIFPKSEAYKLGFEKGSYYAGIENGLNTYSALLEDYDLMPEDQTLRAEQMTPALIKQLAAGMWKLDGLMAMLENSESNRADYENGFLRGYFG